MGNCIKEFDIWRPGYGGAGISIFEAGTTTLAALFQDEALTVPYDNPLYLMSRSDEQGTNYGKFEVPLYTATAYTIAINGTEETGTIRPPLTTLDGEDGSGILITPAGSSFPVTAAELASRTIFAANYGLLTAGSDSSSAATNTATINLAVAALVNGGEIIIPAGRFRHNAFSLPEGVVLTGAGDGSTYLESVLGDKSYTLTGSRAGFRKLSLDGVSLAAGSIGVYAVGQDEVIFDEVTVQRFETNAVIKGGNGHRWTALKDVNSINGFRLLGDKDVANGGLGGAIQDITWIGGLVTQNSTNGVEMSYEDALVQNILFVGVGFVNNTGTAEKFNGVQLVNHINCWWEGNTINWDIQDDTDTLTPSTSLNNDSIGVRAFGGRMSGGTIKLKDTAQDVVMDTMRLTTVAFNLQVPLSNGMYLISCTETGVTVTGETTKLLRSRPTDRGQGVGLTTSNVQTKAWSMPLAPGQLVILKIRAIGKQRNGTDKAMYETTMSAYRPGSTLAYDTQTVNFTLGDVLTGGTSAATARIIADSDSGTTGTLTLTDIQGIFLDDEIITGSSGGSAQANGTQTNVNVSLGGTAQVFTYTYETDSAWNVAVVANGPEVEVQVLGAASKTIEWTVDVDVVST